MLAEHDPGATLPPPNLSWQAFYSLAESAPFGIYIVDSDFRIALINAVAQERAFRNVQPAVGRAFAEAIRVLWPEDVAAAVVAEFRRTLDTGASYRSHDYVHPRADSGNVEAYEWELHRITLPDGSYGVVCYYYESTMLHEVQRVLRNSEERQGFLLTFSDSLRAQSDEDAVCVRATQLLVEALHVDSCSLAVIDVAADTATITHHAGRTERPELPYTLRLSDFPTPLQRSFERSVVCRDVAQDPSLTGTDRQSLLPRTGAFVSAVVRRGDRNPIWALSVSCMEPRNWQPNEVALVEDCAERTWLALERARANQTLRDADTRKDEFLAMLAHELRNPLAAISNAGHILLRTGCRPETLRATAELLNRQVGHMVRQVDDLLDMSRISRGKIELRKEYVNLAKIVTHAVEATRPLMDGAQHDLSIALPPNPLFVLGDPVRLAQVVGNLLNNAAKFTDRGGRIRLALEQEGDAAVVRVRDNGIGIRDTEQDRIFDLFVQVDETSGNTRGGLGLGLPLVRKLVELHGGSVGVHSQGLTHGTEFEVRLPLLAQPQAPQDEGQPAELGSVKRRVLVVDDNRDSANSLATLLTLMGHDVDTAHDGVEAVQKAVTFQPDLILLDIGMPRLSGYEAVRWIHEQGHKNLTIVALTGWGQEDDRRRSAEAGFDAHIVKPIDVPTLTRLLAAPGPAGVGSGAGPQTGA